MKVRELRLAVLVSGGGTNLQALISAVETGLLPAKIVLVLSSSKNAYALERATRAGIETKILCPTGSRNAYDATLAEIVASYEPDYIFLLGWMRILTNAFISKFPGKIINLHPALPGQFPGVQAIERAWDAFQRGEIGHSGVMTHIVDDERVDAGPLLLSAKVDLLRGGSLADFSQRIHTAEHKLVVETALHVASMSIERGE